eukprot:gb/GECH01006539.1/.p1 GENE.gb/GECH01006539.1/~~gb/GECH01006539.1/.p1  ORF type:complete len:489 (+),score=87.62 gb/GECH01006539.1/:1-1467(+)
MIQDHIFVKIGTWYTLLIFLVIWIIFIIVLSSLLYRRRHHPYLKARSFNMIVLCTLGSGLGLISPGLFILLGNLYPCWATHVGAATSSFLVLLPDVFRCIRLILLDRIGKAKVEIAEKTSTYEESNRNASGKEKKRLKHQKRIKWMIYFTKDKTFFKIYGILFVWHVFFFFFWFAIHPEERSSTTCATELSTIHGMFNITSYEITLLILSVAIFRIREEFNIKRGIWITVVLGVAAMIGQVLWLFAVPKKIQPYFPETGFYDIAIAMDVFNVAVFPLFRSYMKQYQTLEFMEISKMDGEPKTDLEKVLRSSEQRFMFCEYCKGEFAAENFYYWIEIERLKQSQEPKEIAEELISKYIAEDSALTLNISANNRIATLTAWHGLAETEKNKIEAEFFESVSEEVKRNMLDTFLRFRQSAVWERYQKRVAQELEAYSDLLVKEEEMKNNMNSIKSNFKVQNNDRNTSKTDDGSISTLEETTSDGSNLKSFG